MNTQIKNIDNIIKKLHGDLNSLFIRKTDITDHFESFLMEWSNYINKHKNIEKEQEQKKNEEQPKLEKEEEQVNEQGNEDELYIFIDNSNLWIESQRLDIRDFKCRVLTDSRSRIDMESLINIMKNENNKKKIKSINLYCSLPNNNNNNDNINYRKVLSNFEKSGIKIDKTYRFYKEKMVDSKINVDITELVCNSNKKGKIIVICGDSDFFPSIKKALDYEWEVELKFWKHSISKKYYNYLNNNNNNDNFKISLLDDHKDRILFKKYKYNKKIINEKTLIITDLSKDEKMPDIDNYISTSFSKINKKDKIIIDYIKKNKKKKFTHFKIENFNDLKERLQYISINTYQKWLNDNTVIIIFDKAINQDEILLFYKILSTNENIKNLFLFKDFLHTIYFNDLNEYKQSFLDDIYNPWIKI